MHELCCRKLCSRGFIERMLCMPVRELLRVGIAHGGDGRVQLGLLLGCFCDGVLCVQRGDVRRARLAVGVLVLPGRTVPGVDSGERVRELLGGVSVVELGVLGLKRVLGLSRWSVLVSWFWDVH